MDHFFKQLGQLSPGTLAAIVALAGACGAILSAIVTTIVGKFFVSPFLGARDRQDREVEWRKHAIELTKLDLERKLRTRNTSDTTPLRPSILDFLANYRDLQELGAKTPKELYQAIKTKRISSETLAVTAATLCDGTVNTDYPLTTLRTTGGSPPLKWSVTPALPAGLALNPDTGIISGKPSVSVSNTTFVFTVTDSAVPAGSATARVTLAIN
jgi:hypothetical protein